MQSILHRILTPTPERIFLEQLEALRRIESAHPWLPRFDEGTLPARREGESEISWRDAQLDVLQAWVRHVAQMAEDTQARARLGYAAAREGVT